MYVPDTLVVGLPEYPHEADYLAHPLNPSEMAVRNVFLDSAAFVIQAVAKNGTGRVVGVVGGDEVGFAAWRAANVSLASIVDPSDYGTFTAPEWNNVVGGGGGTTYDKWQVHLSAWKKVQYERIDNAARQAIAQGYEFPAASGNMVSLSANAQSTWHGMYNMRAMLTYPVTVGNLDDSGSIELADPAAVEAFYGTMATVVRAILDNGVVAKAAIRATENEWDALHVTV